MLAQLKYGTSASQIFWGCDESDTGGVLGVYIDGVLTTGETLAAGNDYTGIVEVTGLSSGSHTWQLDLDGTPQGSERTFETAPATGENFDMIYLADMTGDCQGFSTILNENARYGITNGDHYYLDVAPNFTDNCTCGTLPDGADAVVYATVLATYRCKHRCHLSFGTARHEAFQQFPWSFNWHNHEFEVQPFQTTTVADNAGIKYQAAKLAADEYMFAGNAPVTGNYDTYPNPRVYHDFTVGDAHFVVADQTSYGFQPASAYSNFEGSVPDGAAGTNTGSLQVDFIVDKINSSTSKFLFLSIPAEPVHSGQNATVGAQWQLILDAIDASTQTIVILSGDTHGMMAQLLGGTKLPTNPVLNINASPLEHPLRSTATTAWVSNGDTTLYTLDQTEPTGAIQDVDTDYNYNYMVISVNPEGTDEVAGSHVKFAIKNALTGGVRASFHVLEGEREPVFPSDNLSGLIR